MKSDMTYLACGTWWPRQGARDQMLAVKFDRSNADFAKSTHKGVN